MNNYSNKTYRQKINDNGTQNSYSTVLSNETVNRKMPLVNSNDYYYDQQTDIQFITRSNQQNCIPAPSSINLLPLDSSSLTSCRRIRAQLEENDDFIPVNNRSKKRCNDDNINNNNNNDKICYDQQQHNGRPRYPTRFQNRQHQQNHESEKIDKELTSNSERNQQDHQPVRQEQKVSIAATRYTLTRFPFSPFVVRFFSGNIKEKLISHDLEKYFKEHHHVEIQIAAIRKSTTK